MIKKILLAATAILFLSAVYAQNPVKWSFDAKKKGVNLYELHLTAEINDPWHIYSQFTPKGGPLPTSISFVKNPLIIMVGTAKEEGKIQKKHEDVFDLDVKYYNNQVTFVQLVKLKKNVKTNISGEISFMVCTDRQCLPPAEVPFSIKLN